MTTPPGTALVRIIGNPNHTAATSERRLRCEAGTGLFSNSDSSSMPPTRSASVAVPDTDMGRSPPGRGGRNEPPRPPPAAGGAAPGGGGGAGGGVRRVGLVVLVGRAGEARLEPGVQDAEGVHGDGRPQRRE